MRPNELPAGEDWEAFYRWCESQLKEPTDEELAEMAGHNHNEEDQ